MKKNSIAILVPCLAYGGAERQISLIAPRLRKEGHKVIILSMIPPKAFVDMFRMQNIPVYNIGMKKGRYSAGSFLRIRSIIKKHHADTLITFNFPANFSGRIIKMTMPGLRLITSIRSSTFGGNWRTRFMRFTRNLDFKTVPNSFNIAERFSRKGVIAPDKLQVIQNGIEIPTDAYIQQVLTSKSEELRQELLQQYSQDFLWLAVGRHELPKDYPTLIEACSLLKNAGVLSWHMVIVGGGTLMGETQHLVRKYGLEKHITIAGEQHVVLPYYHAADAYISSSAWEGMPNALVESMMCGTPGIATNVGEVSRIITPEQNGLIVDSRSPEALSKAMQRMMASKEQRLEMGRNARSFVISELDIEQTARKWTDILS